MQVFKDDIAAIMNARSAILRARYLEMEGEEVMNLANSLNRLLSLKARIEQQLKDDEFALAAASAKQIEPVVEKKVEA